MHAPVDGQPLPFPVHLKPWIVANLRASRAEMRAAFGPPHFVETDSTRTCGGDEDNWAWELPSRQRVLLVLQVPTGIAMILCDPPEPTPAAAALGIDMEMQRLELRPTPIVHPAYSGP